MANIFESEWVKATTLATNDIPKREYLIEGFIAKGSLSYLVGPPASFKTNFMMYVALCGGYKDKVMDFKVNKPITTLFIDEENGLVNTKFNLMRISKGMGIDFTKKDLTNKIYFSCIKGFKIDGEKIVGLEEIITKSNANLVVIDNIARVMVGDERDEKCVSIILNLLKPLIEKHDVSFIIIHHCRKGNPKELDDISGSRDFGAQCDDAYLLKYATKVGESKKFLLKQLKSKFGMENKTINFVVDGNDDVLTIKYVGTAKDNILNSKITKILSNLIEYFEMNPKEDYETKELVSAMMEKGHKETNIFNALKDLVTSGLLSHEHGHYKVLSKEGV